jgi:hypothetical protein
MISSSRFGSEIKIQIPQVVASALSQISYLLDGFGAIYAIVYFLGTSSGTLMLILFLVFFLGFRSGNREI